MDIGWLFRNKDDGDDELSSAAKGVAFQRYCELLFLMPIKTDFPAQPNGFYGDSEKVDIAFYDERYCTEIYIECKWSSRGRFTIPPEQWNFYKGLQMIDSVPVTFLMVGDGDDPSCPNNIYLIPFMYLDQPTVNLSTIGCNKIRKTTTITCLDDLIELSQLHPGMSFL